MAAVSMYATCLQPVQIDACRAPSCKMEMLPQTLGTGSLTKHCTHLSFMTQPSLMYQQGWTFVRFSFDVEQSSTAQTIEYAVVQGSDTPVFTERCRFSVAAAGASWRMGFYSCNGFHVGLV